MKVREGLYVDGWGDRLIVKNDKRRWGYSSSMEFHEVERGIDEVIHSFWFVVPEEYLL